MPAPPDESLDLLKALAESPDAKLILDDRPEAGVPFRLESDFRPAPGQAERTACAGKPPRWPAPGPDAPTRRADAPAAVRPSARPGLARSFG